MNDLGCNRTCFSVGVNHCKMMKSGPMMRRIWRHHTKSLPIDCLFWTQRNYPPNQRAGERREMEREGDLIDWHPVLESIAPGSSNQIRLCLTSSMTSVLSLDDSLSGGEWNMKKLNYVYGVCVMVMFTNMLSFVWLTCLSLRSCFCGKDGLSHHDETIESLYTLCSIVV